MKATIDGGFWAQRRRFNREVLIPDGGRRLAEAGNFANLHAAAHGGEYTGLVYQDSDLHKWLEAVGWELQNAPSRELQRMADETVALLAAAQASDGYLDTAYQVPGRERYTRLGSDHEIYCMGHLIEAGVAHPPLLPVARRVADHLVATFTDRWGTCGHPEAELALVKLYRATGERSYLALAQTFLDRRGYGRLRPLTFDSAYLVDRVPVREQTRVEGHAVRALYLNCGATDLYLETGEPALLEAMLAQWEDMTAGKTYITGGVGSDAAHEGFGAAYDLAPETAYAETCAAIASVMWNWRLLQATGEARFADLLERTLYNGVLVGVALETSEYAYANTLGGTPRRHPWYACACCPPNVMRLLASLPQYLATEDERGLTLHQYATGRFDGVRVRTDYPWDGRVEIETDRALRVRIPGWCAEARVNGERVAPGYVAVAPGRVDLDLDLRVRIVEADPRVDGIRGCVALERGPLVYCVEGELSVSGPPRAVARPDLLGGIVAIEWGEALAVPYALSGNRGEQPMRVWLPQSESVRSR